MTGWRDMWGDWCSAHPMTVFYLLVVGTLNLLLNVLSLVVK